MRVTSYHYIILLVFIVVELSSQTEIPDLLGPDQVYPKEYCTPGVIQKSKSKGASINFFYSCANKYNSDSLTLDLHNHNSVQFKIKYPVINQCQMKLVLGFEHMVENMTFKSQQPTETTNVLTQRLKSNRISMIVLKPINQKSYLSISYILASNGNFKPIFSMNKENLIHRAIISLGFKKSENKEWGLGLYAKSGFRSRYILPFGFYNQTFNEQWGIESIILSRVYLRYNHSENSIFLVGSEYRSRDYAINENQFTRIIEYKFPRIINRVVFQRKLYGWFWLEASLGYRVNLSAPVTYGNGESLYELSRRKNGLAASLSIFITPPNKFLK